MRSNNNQMINNAVQIAGSSGLVSNAPVSPHCGVLLADDALSEPMPADLHIVRTRPSTGFLSTLITCVVVFTVVASLNVSGILRTNRISGQSMLPNYKSSEVAISSTLAPIARYDVVTAHAPDGLNVIKRVVGMPGDTVDYDGDHIFVNGILSEEKFVGSTEDAPDISGHLVLGTDEYFLAGDNRSHSKDSRTYGAVKKSALKGKVILAFGK